MISTDNGECVGREANRCITGGKSKRQDKEPQRPKIGGIGQFLASKAEHVDKLCKKPTL
jgi:hypothetical protein